MRIAVSAAAALAAVALLSTAACSSTTSGNPTAEATSASIPTTPAPSGSSGPTGFPSSPSSSVASGGLTAAQAQAALLTAAEVGGGFSQTQTDDTDTPLPCTPSDPPLDQRFPPTVKVQSDFAGLGGKALFSEEIESYADDSTVEQVVSAGEQGLSCAAGKISGVQVKIQGPTDLSSVVQVPVDKAEAWQLTSPDVNAALILVRMGTALAIFSFAADPSVDTTQLPDSEHVFNAGLNKLAAALK